MTAQLFHNLQQWQWRGWHLCNAGFAPLLARVDLHQLAADNAIAWPAQIAQAVPKRQAEYLAARLLLRRLQHQLGLTPAQILPGADRSPCWPAGQQGSVSHSGDLVLAGLGSHTGRRLGVDLEQWLTSAQYQELAPAILSADEQQWCQRENSNMTLAQQLTLIFAAKEALYKALYPDCRQIMEFSAARVMAITASQILLQLTQDWSADWCAGNEIWLEYQTSPHGVQVLTEVSSRTAASGAGV
ncbi:4'-phosphopantetheinyl transferase superfamily protein [Rheinheimera sp. F8]|uniref:4'-phosphopantetheinyl transferase family protein n=1 Tax=Rheinheimera sp. F8 TaxID=1763998 RepID=UPI000B2FD4F3|nr:4'-phosphopantetheinyl transferase superfamily protein [Rheinheimera sp. F8]